MLRPVTKVSMSKSDTGSGACCDLGDLPGSVVDVPSAPYIGIVPVTANSARTLVDEAVEPVEVPRMVMDDGMTEGAAGSMSSRDVAVVRISDWSVTLHLHS
jgi:hypothetical protein